MDKIILGESTREIEVEGFIFSVRQEEYGDIIKGGAQGAALGITEGNAITFASIHYAAMNRIVDWDGPIHCNCDTCIEAANGGEEPKAICDDKHKNLFFAKKPQLLWKLIKQINEQMEQEIKNSETSQDGTEDEPETQT